MPENMIPFPIKNPHEHSNTFFSAPVSITAVDEEHLNEARKTESNQRIDMRVSEAYQKLYPDAVLITESINSHKKTTDPDIQGLGEKLMEEIRADKNSLESRISKLESSLVL